jgi:hypothetical protein
MFNMLQLLKQFRLGLHHRRVIRRWFVGIYGGVYLPCAAAALIWVIRNGQAEKISRPDIYRRV